MTNDKLAQIFKTQQTAYKVYRDLKNFRIDNENNLKISHRDIKTTGFWSNIMKLIFTKWYVANEIIDLEQQLFNLMFSPYAQELNEQNVSRIVFNPSNVWVKRNSASLTTFWAFCYQQFSSAQFKQQVCEQFCDNVTLKIYDEKLQILDDIIKALLNDVLVYEKIKWEYERNDKIDNASILFHYNENIKKIYEAQSSDNTLLNIKGDEN